MALASVKNAGMTNIGLLNSHLTASIAETEEKLILEKSPVSDISIQHAALPAIQFSGKKIKQNGFRQLF